MQKTLKVWSLNKKDIEIYNLENKNLLSLPILVLKKMKN
jgi:hypothetical protein